MLVRPTGWRSSHPPAVPSAALLPQSTGAAAEALAALKEFQREDFEGIFTAMDGLPGEPSLHALVSIHQG